MENIDEDYNDGRDEPNLAEMPYYINSQRASEKTIKYSSTIIDRRTNKRIPRSLTITSGHEHGMPTPLCGKVILGAMQFDLKDEDTTTFSYRALAEVIGMDKGQKSLNRIKLALDRYVGTTLYYENSWYDRRNNKWKSQSFHIIDSVTHDSDGESSIRWGKEFLVSLQEGYLKPLDFKLFRKLKSSHSEILFRFLDKKFYKRHECDFSFSDLAYNHMGFDKKVPIRELKRRLKKPLEELEAHCFIARNPNRFYKSRGEWRVKFSKPTKNESFEEGQQDLIIDENKELTNRFYSIGFSKNQYEKLVKENNSDFEKLERQLEYALYLRTQKNIKSIVPYLIKLIEDDPVIPEKMTTEAQRMDDELKRTAIRREETLREQEREAATQKEWDDTAIAVNNFLDNLDEKERNRVLKLKPIASKAEGSKSWLLAVDQYMEEINVS